jgi:hypothetical protein
MNRLFLRVNTCQKYKSIACHSSNQILFSTTASSSLSISSTATSSINNNVKNIEPHPSDFDHHHTRVARLNHGSFGATPAPVLNIQKQWRDLWLAQPDALYFSGELHQGIRDASICAGKTLVPTTPSDDSTVIQPPLTENHLCLVENATVAACAIAQHWGKSIQPGDVVVSTHCIGSSQKLRSYIQLFLGISSLF